MNRSGTTTRPAGGKSVMLRWLSHLGVFGFAVRFNMPWRFAVNMVRTSGPSLVSVVPLAGNQDLFSGDLRKRVRQDTQTFASVHGDCHSAFA